MSAQCKVAERPLLMSGQMVRAVLEGRKMQTRRVVKPQPELIYGLNAERLSVVYNAYEDKLWRDVEVDPGISEFGLHGGRRWEDLFQDQICRLWQEGVRGLVSIARKPKQQGVFECLLVPQKREGNQIDAPPGMHGLSRNADNLNSSSTSSRWEQGKQFADEPSMGNAARSVAGREDSWDRSCWGKTLGFEAIRCGTRALALGNTKGTLQSAICGADSTNVPRLHLTDCCWKVASSCWVRETWGPCEGGFIYAADEGANWKHVKPDDGKWHPSIFMPRCASRLTLEIVAVRVEHLQEISERDCYEEGITRPEGPRLGSVKCAMDNARYAYRVLWDSLNAKRGLGWSVNPWVFVIEFKRL